MHEVFLHSHSYGDEAPLALASNLDVEFDSLDFSPEYLYMLVFLWGRGQASYLLWTSVISWFSPPMAQLGFIAFPRPQVHRAA